MVEKRKQNFSEENLHVATLQLSEIAKSVSNVKLLLKKVACTTRK